MQAQIVAIFVVVIEIGSRPAEVFRAKVEDVGPHLIGGEVLEQGGLDLFRSEPFGIGDYYAGVLLVVGGIAIEVVDFEILAGHGWAPWLSVCKAACPGIRPGAWGRSRKLVWEIAWASHRFWLSVIDSDGDFRQPDERLKELGERGLGRLDTRTTAGGAWAVLHYGVRQVSSTQPAHY